MNKKTFACTVYERLSNLQGKGQEYQIVQDVSVFAEEDSNSDKMWHFWHLGKIMISKVHLLAGYCYSWHFTFYIHGQNIFHWQILTFNYVQHGRT